jgi:membrane protease YdiL (CAAX protease family)
MVTEPVSPAFRLKPIPIVVTFLLGVGVLFGGALIAKAASVVLGTPGPEDLLPWLYIQHALQLLVALVAIAVLRRFVPLQTGLQRPPGKSYLAPALLWGLAFGVLMVLVDHAPDLLARTAPKLDYALTPRTVAGWLVFEGIWVGPTEEIPFRSLLVAYLAATMPGQLRAGRFTVSWAGIIVSLMFCLAHIESFWSRPWPLALGQQLYAFALGVLYAWLLERSKSIVAAIVCHNVGDFVEYAIVMLWVALT